MTDPDIERPPITRRKMLVRVGEWSLGVAATFAGLSTFGASPAEASPGCCDIYYTRACTGQEWSQGCGFCSTRNNELGNPDGKWYWTCPENGHYRFCGECWFRSCSMSYTTSYNIARCNSH